MNLKSKLKILFLFLLVYTLFSFISLNRHSKSKIYTYHSELWADKAGYNVYLPSLFIYDFEATQFPDSLDSKVGYGFTLNAVSKKIITKYPYGVSLLQSPFWLVAHCLSKTKDGYSMPYQKSIDFAGCFYLTLGLFFLFFIFNKLHSVCQSILFSLLILFSSGIFYYGIFETGMSHIYSFCTLSILLYLLVNKNSFKTTNYLLLTSTISIIYLIIRPINALFLAPLLIYFMYLNHENYFNRKTILNISKQQILLIASIFILLTLPQLLYYKYAFGSFLVKSYQNEPFEAPTIKRITELLLSPNNGLLIYYPVCLVMVIYSFLAKHKLRFLLLSLIIIYILIYASWWSLSLGCGFGHRAMNDIILVFFLPLLIFSVKPKIWLILTILVLAIVNFKFIFSYDSCLYTSVNWDFSEYQSILFGEFK
jgi:hypothetical protein